MTMRHDPNNENRLWAMYEEACMELILHAAKEYLLDVSAGEADDETILTVTVDLDEAEVPSVREDDILSPGHAGNGRPARDRLELFLHGLQERGLLGMGGESRLRFEAGTDEEAALLERLTLLLGNAYSPPTAEQRPRYCVATVRVAVALDRKNPDCHYDDERWAQEAIEAELIGLELVADHEFVSYPSASPLPARKLRKALDGPDPDAGDPF